ncbi:unnamed protein product [Mytilus edulis]|uniref:PiggyBac transposable element-derived protein domain-containing protein n=1 Tax=Mytilus edulis TaxID=6550 RepID=A0A8S3SNK2_MYTED|nr:unnamed protein product [Mytilus edulis]
MSRYSRPPNSSLYVRNVPDTVRLQVKYKVYALKSQQGKNLQEGTEKHQTRCEERKEGQDMVVGMIMTEEEAADDTDQGAEAQDEGQDPDLAAEIEGDHARGHMKEEDHGAEAGGVKEVIKGKSRFTVGSLVQSKKVTKMSSDESDEFEGFSQGEIDEAEARYQHQLLQQGLGDDSDGFIESDDSDIEINDDIPGPAGDAGNVLQNGWHEQFIYHERGMPHLFTPSGISGPTRIMPQDQDPTDFLKLFLTDMLIENLINEADRYALKQKEQHPNQNKMAWVKPTVPEMNAFLGLCFQMGVDRKPSTKMYWSTDHFLHTPVFPNTMSRDRFTQIMRYLHFSNSELEPLPGAENYDPLFKVKPLVNHFNACFNQEYNPKRNVTVDECMIPFKGRVQFRQYMPAKPHKWGVKVWMLAESQSSYIKIIDIYPGRRATPQLHLASNVVKRCLQGAQLEGKGYHVYTDNFFSSPELFEDLFQNYGITAACETVRINRRGLPVDIIC